MTVGGLKRARELTDKGFHYDNLITMAKHCRGEDDPDRMLTAYILNRFFLQLADDLGDGPVISSELRKLEAKYRTLVNLSLEKALAVAPQEEQKRNQTIIIDDNYEEIYKNLTGGKDTSLDFLGIILPLILIGAAVLVAVVYFMRRSSSNEEPGTDYY